MPGTSPHLTPVPAPSGGLFDVARAALDGATGDVALDLTQDLVAGSATLDGTADDGAGPGRLLVVVSSAGTTAAGNLCLDREFAQGGRCEEIGLPGGDVLYRRGLVAVGETRTIVVAIRRADGSGVLLEADNFRITLPPVLVSGQPRPTPLITRDAPVFSLDELVEIAKRVSTATRGCMVAACP